MEAEAVATEVAVEPAPASVVIDGQVIEIPANLDSAPLSITDRKVKDPNRVKPLRPPPKHALEEKYFLRARKKLGLTKLQCDIVKFRCLRDLGHWLDRPLTGNLMKCETLSIVDTLGRTMEWCKTIMENREVGKYTPEQQLSAGLLMNTTARTFRELSQHIMELVDKTEVTKGNGKRKLNLPPQTNMQVNLHMPNNSKPIDIVATSGGDVDDTGLLTT